MIDAAGAIYLMGGCDGDDRSYCFNDVWVGKDKGADRTRAVLEGYSKG